MRAGSPRCTRARGRRRTGTRFPRRYSTTSTSRSASAGGSSESRRTWPSGWPRRRRASSGSSRRGRPGPRTTSGSSTRSTSCRRRGAAEPPPGSCPRSRTGSPTRGKPPPCSGCSRTTRGRAVSTSGRAGGGAARGATRSAASRSRRRSTALVWSAGRASTLAIVIARYSRPEMARIWSDEAKLARWLDVELAALDAGAELGLVPAGAARADRERAQPPSAERVAELEATLHHDTAAFVDAVAETLGPDGRWFHHGLTSSDVVDTGLALQVRAAGELLLEGVARAQRAVVARAEEHRQTVCIGRTHGIHAEPTTFGLKLAGWAFELDRGRERLRSALERMRAGKLSGAVGTYAATDPELERLACERLGLEPEPVSTQILQRDRHAELLSALALVGASIERFALELPPLSRTEVPEVAEPFGRGQKGSSAMPHKRNPVVAERICGLARVLRANALVGLENVALWHERDISHSSAERVVIPDSFLALDYMLERFGWLVEGLDVRPERMRRNLESGHGLFFSQRLLLALVESGLPRGEAYRLVQRHALRTHEEEQDFRELVRADEEIAGRVDLDATFDLAWYTRHVDAVFERLGELARKEEAVHA